MTEITEILYQWRQGKSQRQVATLTRTSRNTIRKIITKACSHGLARGQTNEEELLAISAKVMDELCSKMAVVPGSIEERLSLHHEQIKQWLVEPHMTIRQVGRLLKELTPAVIVSETSLHRYIKKYFPTPVKATMVLHTLAGEQAQVDFGYAGLIDDPPSGKQRRMYAFVMTLSYSRMRYVQFVYRQDIQTWIDCHVKAFSFFGGVPQTVLLDNLKAGVIKPHIYDPIINRSYAECARYYGFIVDPAKVRTPEHKGKVERSIPIVRQQVLAGRSFKDIGALNHYSHDWCQNIIASVVTRTTGEMPRERFERDEKAKLISLPEIPYEYTHWQEAKVGRDQHITVKGSFYSVPIDYIGETVVVKLAQKLLKLYFKEKLIKTHSRLEGKGKWSTDDADLNEKAKHFIENNPSVCLDKAAAIGIHTSEMLLRLLNKPSTSGLRKSQAILRLAEKHGSKRLEKACARALEFDNTSVESLKKIIELNLDERNKGPQHILSSDDLSDGAFLRDPSEFTFH